MSPFDRCTDDTVAVFNTAVAEARRLGHNYVGTEHLLVALVRHRDVLPDAVSALLPGDVGALTATLEGLLGAPRCATPSCSRRSVSTSTRCAPRC